jgi:hypothetical protein
MHPIASKAAEKECSSSGMCILPGKRVLSCVTVVATLVSPAPNAFADANSWLKPTSGNWEEPYWSQGVLPNYGHSVMITNAGWKAVQIAPSTAQYFPDSLNVYSITVLSPVDSYNTLLLNYAGFDRPLTVNYSLTIGGGAAMAMHSSALQLAGPPGVGLSIGGEFNQNDSSQVSGNQADVGWAGPGVYNLNSGLINLQHLFVGGPNQGVFNQNGGSNAPGIVHFENGGTYNLRDGDFNGATYTSDGAVFRQDGGRVHSILEFHGGQYVLNGGVNYGGVRAPVYGNYARGYASVIQNGGTVFGRITVGGEVEGGGSYTLSNGVISAESIAVGMLGDFRQLGGSITTPGIITVRYGSYHRTDMRDAYFGLTAGFLSSGGIDIVRSGFGQSGGTNQVAGSLVLSEGYFGSTTYSLSGGVLITENTAVSNITSGGFFQSGGTHRVANRLSVGSGAWNGQSWKGYELSGGNLIVSNIALQRGIFRHSGGTVTQSGTLTANSTSVFAAPGTHQFGGLQLSGTNGLTMPSASAITRFRNSSALAWSNAPSLIITNWAGSNLGGGSHRIIFGNSATALTPQQVAKISFHSPAGFPWGLHPAKILSTGEIVPDGLPPLGHNPSRLAIRKLPDSTAEITVTADPGYNYGVLVSSDLANWNLLTNRVATNGTFSVTDPTSFNWWWPYNRFYKAVLMQ